jgi:response regulator RpfG family c-di-GMP phosphodiesterase
VTRSVPTSPLDCREAIAEIDRQRGHQFDPALVDACFLRADEQRGERPVIW